MATATTTTIPVTITDEAAARIGELGMQREFEQMVEHAKEFFPELRHIEVTLEYDPEEPRDPTILISPHRPHQGVAYDSTDWNWSGWFVRTFPPEVCIHFCLLSFFERNDAR